MAGLTEFCEQLRDLRRQAGNPTLVRLRAEMKSMPGVATLSDLFAAKGRRPPRWELVSELVSACVACAARNNIELDGPGADLKVWRRRHEDLLRSMDAAGTEAESASFAELTSLLRTGPNLPLLGDLSDDDLGVSATSREPHPYIPRSDLDDEFAVAMGDLAAPYPYLVVYGDRQAGKTSSAIAGVRAALPSRTVVLVPRNGAALNDLARMGAPAGLGPLPALIWLDNASTADLDALSVTTLNQLAEWAAIVGTISAETCALILDGNPGAGARARTVLRRAYLLYLPLELTEEERTAAYRMYPNTQFGKGIASAFVNVGDLRLRLNTAKHLNAVGAGFVRAAIDADRAGLNRPVDRTELIRLIPAYLDEVDRSALTDEAIAKALAWATEPVAGDEALLSVSRSESGEPCWQAHRELVISEKSPVPALVWAELTDMSDPEECVDIGVAAVHAGRLVHSVAALGEAAKIEEPAGERTFLLGLTLYQIGDFDGAEEALQAVVTVGQAVSVGAAAYLLGRIHSRKDREERAVEYFALAAASDHPWAAPEALWLLIVGLLKLGRIAEAIEPLQRATASEVPEVAARAHAMLGAMAADRGDPDQAVDLWQQALETTDDALGAVARSSIAEFTAAKAEMERLAETVPDKLERADQLIRYLHFGAAIQLCLQVKAQDPSRAADADGTLGEVYRAQGRIEEAIAAYRASMAAGTSESSGDAALSLGALLLENTDDEQAAAAAFEFALRCDGADVQAKAAVNLGLLARRHGDTRLATGYFERAQATGDPRMTAKSALNIVEILDEAGADFPELIGHYRTAITAGDPEFSAQAATTLAAKLIEHDQVAEALELIELAEASGHTESRTKAAWLLGSHLTRAGDLDGAMAAYRRAIEFGEEEFTIAAHGSLGMLLAERDDPEAEEHLSLAYASRHPKWAPEPGLGLGVTYWFSSRYQMAEEVLTWVLNSRHERFAGYAGMLLGSVYLRTGRQDRARRAYLSVIELGHASTVEAAERAIDTMDRGGTPTFYGA